MKLYNVFTIFILINLIDQISNIKPPFIKRLRKTSENQNFISNVLYSEKDNYYYIQLYLGEDKIPQSYILDTTFSFISSPCNLCTSCENHYNPFFIINNDTNIINCNSVQCSVITNQNNCQEEKCYFIIDNNDNTLKNIEGFLVNSKIFLNKNQLLSFLEIPIGCTTKEGIFYNNLYANGLIGLNNNRNTFIDNIYNLNIIKDNLFSICLSKKGGFISFGKISFVNYDSFNYINILYSSHNLFEIRVIKILVGEEILDEDGFISYIDSTKINTYFPKNIYEFLLKNLIEKNENFIYDSQYGYCTTFNHVEERNIIYGELKSIIINFGTYNLEWKPENYITEYNLEEDQIKACLRFK